MKSFMSTKLLSERQRKQKKSRRQKKKEKASVAIDVKLSIKY